MSNEQKAPILPAKYRGATPGPWKRSGIEINGDFDSDGYYTVAILGKKAMKREIDANGLLLEDAPRLAATVVELREELKGALALLERYTGCSDGCTCGDGWKHVERYELENINAALESTKEFQA